MAIYRTDFRRNSAIVVLAAYAIFGHGSLYAQQPATPPPAPAENPAFTEITDEQMQVLVSRIALYPDELVALITSASLYPLQIVEASRFLDQHKSNKDLKPKDDWDGSVVSLLNYPDVVKMMSEDLEWTQQLGDAVASQQKDMLIAIQTLRDKAVADGIIKSDDKVKVVQQNDNVIIQAADPEKIYVPQYPPQMLYEEGYAPAPISYYPDPYPNYYYPTATFFAGFVTGAVFGAVVDWDRWGVWGGRYNGSDIDIDCDHCFNGIDRNGKVNFNDVDWKNVDRSKLKFDHNQFANIDRSNIRNRLEAGGNTDIREKARAARSKTRNIGDARITPARIKDVRADHARPDGGLGSGGRIADRPAASRRGEIGNRPERQFHKPAMAGKRDIRPNRPSGLGEVRSRGAANLHSQRGGRAMGGGHFAAAHGGGHPEFGGHRGRGGGQMRRPHGGRHR